MKYEQPLGTPEDSPYINGNPQTGLKGSIPTAEAFENPQRELVNIITKSKIVPNRTDLLQVARGIRSQALNYGEDHGTPNNLIVDFDPHITTYTPGLILRVSVRWPNSGGCRIDAGGGWAQIVRPDGSQLIEGDFARQGQVANLVFDGTRFQLMNYAASPRAGDVIVNQLPLPYAVDASNTPNRIEAPFLPVLTDNDIHPGLAVLVKVNNTIVDVDTIPAGVMFVNNIATPYPIYANGHGEVYAYDIYKDDVKLFVFDGTGFWFDPNVLVRKFGVVSGWVRPDAVNDGAGDFSADGTANTPQRAFRTIQRAYTRIAARYAPSPLLTVTIKLGRPATDAEILNIANPDSYSYEGCLIGPYGGHVRIIGDDQPDAPNRTRYRIRFDPADLPTPVHCVGCVEAVLAIQGVTLVADVPSTRGFHMLVSTGGTIYPTNINFELRRTYTAGSYVFAVTNANIQFGPGQIIYNGFGNWTGYWFVSNGGKLFGASAPSITQHYVYNTGFYQCGVGAAALGVVDISSGLVYDVGNAGVRFVSQDNSIYFSSNTGIPGNAPGYTIRGGIAI